MKITLSTPFSVGDLAPTASYPHVYITNLYVNGPAQTATITYEIGTMGDASDANPMGVWATAPMVPSSAVQLNGAELYPFFTQQVSTDPSASTFLWDQVEVILYKLIQQNNARMAGEIS